MLVASFLTPITDFIASTHVIEQIKEVKAAALFTNPWFLAPFAGVVGYMLYKKALTDLAILGIFIGIWYVSGLPYMQTLIVNGELQMGKVLPVAFGGAIVLGLLVYLLLNRSD